MRTNKHEKLQHSVFYSSFQKHAWKNKYDMNY